MLLMGKLTISMAIFNSKLLVYQRRIHPAAMTCHDSCRVQNLQLNSRPRLRNGAVIRGELEPGAGTSRKTAMESMGLKPCHFYLPSMTGNGKFIPPIKMVMTGDMV